MGRPKGSLDRGPPMWGHFAGLWQQLICESGRGRRSQGLWEHGNHSVVGCIGGQGGRRLNVGRTRSPESLRRCSGGGSQLTTEQCHGPTGWGEQPDSPCRVCTRACLDLSRPGSEHLSKLCAWLAWVSMSTKWT